MALSLYIASALGALSLFLMMPAVTRAPRAIGALLGAMTLGGLWVVLSGHVTGTWLDHATAPAAYYYIFSAIAIVAAVRVVTHTKPVYSALWFVMVVVSSSGLFVLLQAPFMAIAMIIIYGGAILVTYVFVIMLASHSGDPEQQDEAPDYDRLAREPAAATFAGFLLLAVLLTVLFDESSLKPNPDAAAASDAQLVEGVLQRQVAADLPAQNVERIGLDLFTSHPLGLELAGVILLVSLVGAIVIANTPAETETETDRPAA